MQKGALTTIAKAERTQQGWEQARRWDETAACIRCIGRIWLFRSILERQPLQDVAIFYVDNAQYILPPGTSADGNIAERIENLFRSDVAVACRFNSDGSGDDNDGVYIQGRSVPEGWLTIQTTERRKVSLGDLIREEEAWLQVHLDNLQSLGGPVDML